MVIIGIDPGIAGALGTLYLAANGEPMFRRVDDMPVVTDPGTERQRVNPAELKRLLMTLKGEGLSCQVWIEKVTPVPPSAFAGKGQKMQAGSIAMFGLGRNFGVVEGVVGACDLVVRYVPPQTWKKAYGLLKKDKDVARTVALERIPPAGPFLARKMDHNRAESLLIADFGARQYLAESNLGATIGHP